MPLDRTHQHISTSIMREGAPQTPIDPSGGSGIPQGGPLTADLDADGFTLNGVASIMGDAGGPMALTAAGGAAGLSGQALNLHGGDGDDGNDAAASLTLNPGDGAGNPGVAAINASALTLNGSPVGGIPQGGPLTEDLDAGGFRLTNLADPADGADAAPAEWVAGQVAAAVDGASLAFVLAISNDASAGPIVNLADPTDAQDAATKAYVDENGVANPLAADLDVGGFLIKGASGAGYTGGQFAASDGEDGEGGQAVIRGGEVVGGSGAGQITAFGGLAEDEAGGSVVVRGGDSGLTAGAKITLTGGDGVALVGDMTVEARLIFPNLPTANPNIAGALWADTGVVKVSAG